MCDSFYTKSSKIDGPFGKLEIMVEIPLQISGLAFIAHPHPLFGGTMHNKVVQTLARSFLQLGYITSRLNFRGVGESEGEYDQGHGEQEDFHFLIKYVRAMPGCHKLPFILAGFSFGALITSKVYASTYSHEKLLRRIFLVGMPVKRWEIPNVGDAVIVHGEKDEIIPLHDVFDWVRPQELPIVVIPGAKHFFHRKLHILKNVIIEYSKVR